MVNMVPHEELEQTAYDWAQEIMTKSPTAIKMLKFGFNLIDDGLVGQQVYAGEATRLAYGTDEAVEGRNAFLEKRPRDFSNFKVSIMDAIKNRKTQKVLANNPWTPSLTEGEREELVQELLTLAAAAPYPTKVRRSIELI